MEPAAMGEKRLAHCMLKRLGKTQGQGRYGAALLIGVAH